MLEHEVTPLLKAMRSHSLNVVAVHHHVTDVQLVVIFLHYCVPDGHSHGNPARGQDES